MGRYKSVDRNKVLDAADAIIRNEGIEALTINTVAKAAGISKGGIQSNFGTKRGLLNAMLERSVAKFEARVAKRAGDSPTFTVSMRAYIETTCRIDKMDGGRIANILAVLLNFPDKKQFCQDWYRSRMEMFDIKSPEGRRARLAFIANEGIFFLRFFGFMKIGNTEWNQIFEDLHHLHESPEALM